MKVYENFQLLLSALDKNPDGNFEAKPVRDGPLKYNLTVFEKHIDRLGLLPPDLAKRTILWFSKYAGFQDLIWKRLANCNKNREAATLIREASKHWEKVNEDANILATELTLSAGKSCWHFWFATNSTPCSTNHTDKAEAQS